MKNAAIEPLKESLINSLIESFALHWPLTPDAISALEERALISTFKKRAIILTPGTVCRHLNFVVSGCTRMFITDGKGKQHNLQFAVENQWISDHGSFYAYEQSQLSIEALEPVTLIQIERDDLFFFYGHSPLFDRNFRIIAENAFIDQQKRILQNISATAEERYLYFLGRYPELVNRISNVQIASFLGITPEFLSMIKKKIS